ncbi:membrane fusion protein, multidrug efflux system [Andreprevotia lacus DSM 23236]|jgi:membrane fusion protein (multidrug efflux system)|uniref:Membrane fusion protein, multidrug efflux system n=1 Tax=Andreprevotia lacus DSM 23236 TaxID=1121001 RepID=A0A1W1XU88_9NEIS|nr:HlyD family efflux transporter periplasmic adaptor subunit [Andreprevotia lacus]SMC27523.1 membrane fusion protein, multidrug efflux system [Andreprevotia lacus DSM 23236]
MTTETTPNNNRRKPLMLGATALFVIAGIGYAAYYTQVLSQREETDNAYVGGNTVALTSQVSGTITEIRADETQYVKAGQDVIKLDPADATVSLRQAEAKLGETVRSLRQQYANAEQVNSTLAQKKVDLAKAKDDLARRAPLLAEQAVSAEDVDHARQAVASAQAALDAAQKQYEAASAGIDGVKLTDHPSVLAAKANYVQAWLAARRNAIVAPVSGQIAKRSAQVGARVTPGATLLTIVPLNQLWVDANFKESELKNIRIGQPAKIEADVYGSKVEYTGKVVGLSAGTGSAFSLLPAQNATGNWIKVVQRVPVRIQLDPQQLTEHPLRIGLSTVVTVDTHNRDGAVLASNPSNDTVMETKAFEQPLTEAEATADAIIAKNAGHR